MADEGVLVRVASENPVKIVKWKVRDGTAVSSGQVLCLYEHIQVENVTALAPGRCRAPCAGVVRVRAREGDIVQPGDSIGDLERCKHTTVMKQMCAECGEDLSKDDVAAPATAQAVVPMVHSVPELKVTEELAKKLGREDCERLLRDRKLVLLVDLDQTLVHTTNENVSPQLKNIAHYWLRGPGGDGRWYHTRLRPGTRAFLHAAASRFELHVCTFGARQYAHAVAELLDPKGEYFSHRILSRDECFDARAKAANLKALFPCGDNMVCIIDDRDDVWRHASNLIHVRPYNFFHNTGDINAPPPPLEKNKVTAGHNGAQNPPNPETEMPLLDAEPDTDQKPDVDGSNGRVRAKTDKAEDDGKDVVETDKIEFEAEKSEEAKEPKWKETEDGQMDVQDPDDYLLYLEDILERIHTHFYEQYDKMEAGQIPDLKTIIPSIRAQVLAGTSLVFSGLVPQQQRLEASRAYQVARSLGAAVTPDFTPQTTHLLAVRPGTVKVNIGRRLASSTDSGQARLQVVTPEWLWACAERWQHVDERLYPLQRTSGTQARRPPPHCSSPPPPAPVAAARRRTPSGRFMDTLNPLLSFSSADIADMDKEVEDICNESGESGSEDEQREVDQEEDEADDVFTDERLIAADLEEDSQPPRSQYGDDSSSSASEDSLTRDSTDERPRKRRRTADAGEDGGEPPDDWQQMGEALEREILGLD